MNKNKKASEVETCGDRHGDDPGKGKTVRDSGSDIQAFTQKVNSKIDSTERGGLRKNKHRKSEEKYRDVNVSIPIHKRYPQRNGEGNMPQNGRNLLKR